jgi:hypothetical protein
MKHESTHYFVLLCNILKYSWSKSVLFSIHKATSKLETPAISKSQAFPVVCCDVFLLPIASHNSSDL